MEAIHDVHVSEPGLVVVDIAAAGDKTMFTFHTAPAARWATISAEPEDAAEQRPVVLLVPGRYAK
ncbi:DUF6207 family protein [Streptomyces sp. NPDC048188]|uniref:DUF6207 family protein n=1 Tax=Streptomyces sp. NPDC048188 TaxID=3155749 RepID=UPI0034215FFC